MSNRKKKTVVAAALCMLIAAGGTQAAEPMMMHWKITGLSSDSPSDPVDVPNEPGVEPEPAGPSWQEFADQRGLPYSGTWGVLNWGGRNLTEIPSAPYPNSTPVRLTLSNNALQNLDGLANITLASQYINLSGNQINDLSGLRGLVRVEETLNLRANQLTNLDHLEGLTHAGIVIISDNPLQNINGIANIASLGYPIMTMDGPEWRDGYVIMDAPGAGFQKLPASSPLCQYVASEPAVVFMRPPASTIPYSSVCG